MVRSVIWGEANDFKVLTGHDLIESTSKAKLPSS